MKGKRTISVAMAAIVVSGLLSSCGQSQEEKTGDEKEQLHCSIGIRVQTS